MKHIHPAKAVIIALGLALGITAGLVLSLRSAQAISTDNLAQLERRLPAASRVPALHGSADTLSAILSQWTPPSPAYKIFVEADGLYELDYADLQAAGLPVDTLDPRTFRLFWMGQEVAIQEVGDGDDNFESGEAVLFYGRGVDSLFYEGLLPANKYTGTNVYWLTYDPDGIVNGLRMAEKDGSLSGSAAGPFLHKEHLEDNFWYFSAYPFEHDADHWFWEWIQASGGFTGTRTYNFTAHNVATGALTGTLTVNLLGYKDGLHHLLLYVNDNLVLDDSTSWSDFDVFSTTVDVDQAYFQEGSNTIKVQIAKGKMDTVYTNWLEVGYYDTHVAEGDELAFRNDVTSPDTYTYEVSNFSSDDIKVYDVSDMTAVRFFTPTTVTGSGPYAVTFGDVVSDSSRYLALTPAARLSPAGIEEVTHLTSAYTPADLLDLGNGAQYVLITHGDFWDEALDLAVYRAQEYSVALVDAQEIYDQFNGGLMSAEAIHDFLAYTYDHWQPRPEFVLLLGDGTSDMRNYKGNSAPTYIPPYLYLADPDMGETAADNRFVTLVDSPGYPWIMPDMHIGRMPANTPAEAQAMIDKTIAYGAACCDPLTQNVLFVADDEHGGSFYDLSDAIADGYEDPPTNTIKYLPPPYTSTKLYLGQTCDVSNPPLSIECRYKITHTLNVTGSLLVSFIGHSTKTYWAAERMSDEASLSTLTNTNVCQLPIMLAMTCYEGSFHEPASGFQSLGEVAVRMADTGAVASWSPTGFGEPEGHDLMEKGFFLALFHDGVEELGAAITQGKQYLLDHRPAPSKYVDLVDTFVLLGDPALKVKVDNDECVPTAVCVAEFAAQPQGGGVLVEWQTANEVDALGFNVLRAEAEDGEYVAINSELIFARRSGSDDGAAYAYFDEEATAGKTYHYRLEIVKLDGQVERYGLAEATVGWRLCLPVVVR